MSRRVSPVSPVGSLLKALRPSTKRDLDREHLALIRRCPCAACDADPAAEAAHVRMTLAGKPITGLGMKPHDRWTVPLCHSCHMRQHAIGEVAFWHDVGLHPLVLARALYWASPDIEEMRAIILRRGPL